MHGRLPRPSGKRGLTAGKRCLAALELWRDTPLADLLYEPFARAEIARLEELRLVALEDRIDADLELGGADELVAELEALVREHPLRERLRAQLMLALYRSGRQAEALVAYQEARAAFAEELALEPGPALRELEHAILTHEPELGAARRIPRTARSDRRRGAALLALAGAVLLAAAVTVAVIVLSGGSVTASLRSVAPDSLAFIDPVRNAVVGELPVGSGPAAVTVGDGSVWVANAGDQTLARIDPRSKQVVDRTGLGRIPTQLAFGQGALWIASAIGERGVVLRVDPAVRAVTGEATVRAGSGDDVFAPPTPSAIAVGNGGVLTNDLHSQLWWLSHGGRARTLALGASHSVDGLAIGEGAVWVASGADDRVLRLIASPGGSSPRSRWPPCRAFAWRARMESRSATARYG
jgi:Bacterial transcriptional activator domain